MDWKKIKMGDILQVKKGEYITKKDSNEGIYPVILGGREPAYYIDKYNHIGKAIVISRSGASAGYVSFWNEPIFVTDGFLIEPKDGISYEFLYYSLKFKQQILHSSQKGAAIPHVTPYLISSIDSLLPDEKTQIRLASVLSAYDNLIENNNRRIRLLEQMAENLYKEWFVRFRFPGHEKAEFENGLPKGWKRAQLKTICKFERGKNITASEMISGSVPVISAGVSPSGFHNQSNVFGASVTISSSGANAGFISIHYEDIWAADCSFISEESTKYIYYVYEVLNNMRPVVDNFQRGAAQPHVYPKDLNRILVVVPEEHIREKANDRFYQLHQLISKLLQQNKHLSRQRDLLLPRLMSGKLEVKV